MGNSIIVSILRTAAQTLVGSLAVFLTAHNIDFPLAQQQWFVEALAVGGGVAVYTAIVRWLETRDHPFSRFIARILMLGLHHQPTYTPPAPKEPPALG